MDNKVERICITCKYMAQGKNCSFCANKDQKEEGLKTYTYWPFSCKLWENGIHSTRKSYMRTVKNIFSRD